MRLVFKSAIIAVFVISMASTTAIAQSGNAERQRQEQQRRADEQRRQAEARQRQEQQRRADEQRRQAEARQQQEQRQRAEEQRRQAEAKQQQEQRQRAEEQRRQAEAKQQQEQQQRTEERRKELELKRQANAAASGAATPSAGASGPSNGGASASGERDSSRTRKVHNPAADAKRCVKMVQTSASTKARISGNFNFRNECDSTVEIFWCFPKPDGRCGSGGTWTVSAGKGWPVMDNEASIKWGACRGRDGGGWNKNAAGGTYTCELLKW